MALGAQMRDVLNLVVLQGMTLALAGIAIGLLAGLALTGVLSSMLYDFTERDTTNSSLVVIINEAFAKQVFPNENPLGQRLGIGDGWWRDGDYLPREIVGVVQSVRQVGLTQEPAPELYVPHSQSQWDYGLHLAVRTRVAPASLIPLVRNAVLSSGASSGSDRSHRGAAL